jgi:hypothetical protein
VSLPPHGWTRARVVSQRSARDASPTATAHAAPIRLLIGCRLHDIREEPTGGFAGNIGPDAPVGTYAGAVRLRCEGTGSFFGDSDRQRQGSFADADRDMLVSYQDGAERPRVVGDHAVRQLLRGVDAGPAGPVVEELHIGHAVVIAEVAEIAPSEARVRLEQVANAA